MCPQAGACSDKTPSWEGEWGRGCKDGGLGAVHEADSEAVCGELCPKISAMGRLMKRRLEAGNLAYIVRGKNEEEKEEDKYRNGEGIGIVSPCSRGHVR